MKHKSMIVHPAVEVVLEDAGENWGAYAPSVPGVIATGPTEEACRAGMESALVAHFCFVAKEDASELAELAEEVRREREARP